MSSKGQYSIERYTKNLWLTDGADTIYVEIGSYFHVVKCVDVDLQRYLVGIEIYRIILRFLVWYRESRSDRRT